MPIARYYTGVRQPLLIVTAYTTFRSGFSVMGQTDITTGGHGDSMTNLVHRAESVKTIVYLKAQ